MKDIHLLFKKYGINYWADGGTLMGAIRHNGIVPWDDDLDICLYPEHENMLTSDLLKAELDALGYEVISYNTFNRIAQKGRAYPHLDLFSTVEDGDGYVYKHAVFGKRDGRNFHYKKDEVGNTKEHAFADEDPRNL